MSKTLLDDARNITILKSVTDYALWSKEIGILFDAKGLSDLINGSSKFAEMTTADNRRTWKVEDAGAKHCIMSTIDKTIKQHVLTCETSYEMFTKLKNIFEKDSEQQKCLLLQEFYSYKYDKAQSMLENVSKIQNIAYRLSSLNQKIDDIMVITKIIGILPKEYRSFSSAWESVATETKTIENLTARLQLEESKLQSAREEQNNVSFKTELKQRSKPDIVCYKCHRKGHIQRDCRNDRYILYKKMNYHANNNKAQKQYSSCSICKKDNHLEKDCFFRDKNSGSSNSTKSNKRKNDDHDVNNNGGNKRVKSKGDKVSFLSGHSKKVSIESKSKSKYVKSKTSKSKTTSKSKSKNCEERNCKNSCCENRKISLFSKSFSHSDDSEFCVDSGCTCHMTDDPGIMSNIVETEDEISVAKKDQSMSSLGVGTVIADKCNLKNVHYVPDLTKNLISVGAVTDNEGAVLFNKHGVKILKEDIPVPQYLVALEGPKTRKGLFVVNLKTVKTALLTNHERFNLAIQWHRKMGHLSYNNLKKLLKLCDGISLQPKDCDVNTVCDICAKAKQAKLPHNSIRERATEPLQLIHTDVCGSFDPSTYNGKQYFVTFLDDFTHFCVVFLMQYKSDALEYLKQYVHESENFHKKRVCKIRCDNGGEYCSNEWKDWCKDRGITLDYTVPGCPELNGKAERINRTIMERARALLFDSNLNEEMWGEAVLTAVYLINRSPSVTVEKTPAEMWYSKKQSLSRIQLFGSVVHAKILTNLKKLDSRSKEAIFVGYSTNGYRLWDAQKRRIFMSRDVIFTNRLADPKTQGSLPKLSPNHDEETTNQISEEENENNDENTNSEENDNENLEKDKDERRNEKYHLRERRQLRAPTKHQDYEVYFCPNLPQEEIFLTYQDCIKNKQWREAINEEKNSLMDNEVWEFVDKKRAQGKEIITSRWLFKIKENGRHKARLVARGCQQRGNQIDFKELYSPVVDTTSLRILFALAAQNDLTITTFDVKTAFLNGSLDEEIYMTVPEGFEVEENKVCLLKKALYGLKQAPLRWYKRLTTFLRKEGLYNIKSDKCIFKDNNSSVYLGIHVDDGIIFSKRSKESNKLLLKLREEFEITVNENPKCYLGIQFEKTDKGLMIHQSNYTWQVLKQFNMSECNPMATPMEPKTQNFVKTEDHKYPYRQAVGSLLYLSCKTRPDIAFAVNHASRFVENPSQENVKNIKRIFRYLMGTVNVGIHYSSSETLTLENYSDADYAGSGPEGKMKSTTGYVMMFAKGPIQWCSRKQNVVALSTAEAEYIAAAECCKQLQFVKTLLNELIDSEINANLHVDNQGAIKLIKSGQMSSRSKHIDVRYYYISEKYDEGLFKLMHCPSEEQLADIFTKPLQCVKFKKFKDVMCQKVEGENMSKETSCNTLY